MKYIEFINSLINKQVSDADNVVLFGQNIGAGSCLSGLTRKLKVKKPGLIINTPNCENTLAGIGFGLMLNGVSSVFFMKQLDFLLLGADHLVNTYNFIRINKPKASFTIMPIIVDLGFQGMQSSFNNLGDFCSLAKIPGYTITNRYDAENIIASQLINPGFRIIGVSQRLFHAPLLEPEQPLFCDQDGKLFQYAKGDDATIVCFNFSFPQGLELYNRLKAEKRCASLFNVNALTPISWDRIAEDVKNTKKLVIIDDSKSENLCCYNLLADISTNCRLDSSLVIKRTFNDNSWLSPNDDELVINYDELVNRLTKPC